MTSSPALECINLSAGYDKLVVVRNIDLAVQPKQILAILGPNGAGKTTLLMTVAGFLAPIAGTIRMNGAEISRGSARRANQAGIVLVPDFRALFTELGLSLADVVQATVYLADINDYDEMNRAYAGFFPTAPPARETVAVSGIVSGARVEISFIAVKHGRR